MTPQELRKIGYFQYVDDDMLRGTIYYSKRNKIDNKYLSNRPAFRVMKILKREFELLGEEEEYLRFKEWIQKPFTNRDKLHGAVQYFEKQYGSEIISIRYLLTTKNVIDLYMQTDFLIDEEDSRR